MHAGALPHKIQVTNRSGLVTNQPHQRHRSVRYVDVGIGTVRNWSGASLQTEVPLAGRFRRFGVRHEKQRLWMGWCRPAVSHRRHAGCMPQPAHGARHPSRGEPQPQKRQPASGSKGKAACMVGWVGERYVKVETALAFYLQSVIRAR